jgi:hypothetical protein
MGHALDDGLDGAPLPIRVKLANLVDEVDEAPLLMPSRAELVDRGEHQLPGWSWIHGRKLELPERPTSMEGPERPARMSA